MFSFIRAERLHNRRRNNFRIKNGGKFDKKNAVRKIRLQFIADDLRQTRFPRAACARQRN